MQKAHTSGRWHLQIDDRKRGNGTKREIVVDMEAPCRKDSDRASPTQI